MVALLVPASLSLFLAMYGGLIFFGDGDSYFRYADLLAQGRFGTDYYFRTPGYPILIILSGYTVTRSLLGLVLVQAFLATLMPWLTYRTFAPFNRWMGVGAAAVCVCSLTPFFFENTLYPDGAYLFFVSAAMYFLAQAVASGKVRYIHWCFAALTFLYLVRPAGLALLGAWASLVPLWRGRWFRYVVACLALFLLSILSLGQFEKWSLRRFNYTIPVAQTFVGRQFFMNAYLRSAPYGGFEVRGSTLEQVRREAIDFFGNGLTWSDLRWGPHESYQEFLTLYGRYQGHASALVDHMFRRPNLFYYWALYGVGDQRDGGDQQFLILWLRFLQAHPLVVARYTIENFIDLTVGQPWTYGGPAEYPGDKVIQSPPAFWPIERSVTVGKAMPAQSIRFLDQRQPANNALTRALSRLWVIDYTWGRPLFVVLIVGGWLASFRESRALGVLMTAVVAAYVANTFLLSLLVDPVFRYQMQGMTISASSAGAGAWMIARQLTQAIARMCSHGEARGVE